MSLYADYLKELTNIKIVEDDKGFATYEILDKDIYIRDIFVKSDYRDSKTASEYANKICKIGQEYGCKRLLGSVIPTNQDSTASLKILLAYGMKLDSSANNFILFSKEIA